MLVAPPASSMDQAEGRAIVRSFRAGTNAFVRELGAGSLRQGACGVVRHWSERSQGAEAARRAARGCGQVVRGVESGALAECAAKAQAGYRAQDLPGGTSPDGRTRIGLSAVCLCASRLPRGPAPNRLKRHVGQRLARARKAAGLTLQELADQLAWPLSTLANYETGRRPIKLAHLRVNV